MLATRLRNGSRDATEALGAFTESTHIADQKETLLRVRDLSVEFSTPRGVVKAVTDVSLDIKKGERLAIVGESGSGKSIMSMSLLQLVQYPGRIVSGSVMLEG